MASKSKPTEKETRSLQDAIDDDNKRMENLVKNLPKSEAHVFAMPNIENGVTNIGDLWDCRRSEPVGQNLLSISKFTPKILQACPIDKCDMKFRQIRSHEDKIESLHIDAKISLEFLLGRIKLEGQFAYDNTTSSERSVEGILYNYLNEQYRIQLIPRIKTALLNRDVATMLQKGIIKATHVVGGMIIGAEVTAWIEVTDTSSKTEVTIGGKASASFAQGVLKKLSSLSGSAAVEDSDKTNITNHEVKVSVTARPAVERPPTTLDDFLPFIKNLSNDLKNHIKFTHIDSNIFGVPIRFILYPISQYVDFEMDTLYRELTDACQNDFISVIAKCNDLKQAGYIWKIILERNHQLHFLRDSKSEFFKKVDSYEKEIRDFAQDVLSRSRKALSNYKSGESEINEIENIVQRFYKSKASSAQEEAKDMADEGTRELQLAYFDATDNGLQSRVKRFTDRNECDIWLGKANPRLLLEIKPPCSEAIVKSFLDAAQHLIKLDVDLAIAMPSISEGVFLTLKCNEGMEILEGPVLSKALGVLNAVVVEGYSSIHTFYKILGSLCSIRIPLCQDDTRCLDKILLILLRETFCENRSREVCFVRSVCDLTTELAISLDRKVMCLPLRAPDTDLAVVKQFRSLAKQDAFSNVKWIFCNFEVKTYQEAPLLLIFSQSKTVTVCLDNLDILISMDIMNSKSDESRSNFDILELTHTRFANTMYPERAHYTLEIMNRINSDIRISRSKASGFPDETQEESLNHLMMVIRATLHNNIVDLASAVAAAVSDVFPSLSTILETNGWRKMNKKFDSAHFHREDCACELVGELEKWMKDHSFETKVQETQQQLVDLQNGLVDDSNRHFDETLRRITIDDHCPSAVAKQLSKVKSSRQSLKAKCIQVSNILNIDMLKETLEVGYVHIEALIIVLQKSSQKEQLPDTIGGELAYLYSRRSTTVIENAMIENEITRLLRPSYQPYHLLNMLQTLKHGHALMRLYEAFGDLDSLDNSNTVSEIINIAYDELNQANSEVLWKNEQWLFLVRHCLKYHNNKQLIDSLSKWITKNSETGLIPADIVKMQQQSNASKEVASGNRTVNIRDDIIGHEYSFQACGEMYNIALGENLKSGDLQCKLTQRFAENLLAGKAIELVNGDSREIPLAFFRSICRTVSRIRPGMRVFVMTLFELRMSQRSSLLSSFFSCKYASSVERHNIRSLFMRIILIEDLGYTRNAYGYDAIIVLNTESLRSQKVITSYTTGRDNASCDWLSTIFAISLSNLVVVDDALCNAQPRGFERVTEVLFRLREVSILSDLLISRTFNDRASSTEGSSNIIDKTIQRHLDRVTSKHDTIADYAYQLKSRLASGIIYLNVPCIGNNITENIPNTHETMHEDVTNLCQSLLSRANSRGYKFTFEYWSELLHRSWNSLEEQHYWLRLREAQDFLELAYFGKLFATAKELLTRTFLNHRKTILKQVREGCLKEFSATDICQQLETIPSHCRSNCRSCREIVSYREKLYLDVKDTAWQDIIRISFQNHRKSVFESIQNLLEMDIKELLNRQNIAENISKQITDELTKIHKECPRGIFNSVETNVEEIWLTISTQNDHEPSEEEQFALIVDELFPKREDSGFTYDLLVADLKAGRSIGVTEFEETDLILKSVVEYDITPLTASEMNQIITRCQTIARKLQAPTVVAPQDSFNNLHIFKLSNEINHAILKFLSAKRFDYFEAGLKFETVMANEFNEHIVAIVTIFEVKFELSIPENLKRLLQIYILKIFFDRIVVLKKKWNSNNAVLSILSQGETDYKAHISTRLTCGFSNKAEGELAARYLIMLMRQMAIKDEYDANISSFLSIPWVANSETVRLRYFETLALEVAAGKKETALEHFRNPKASLTNWYKAMTHNYRTGYAQKFFSSTLDNCLQEIRNCKDYSDTDKILRRYETVASSTYKYERVQTEVDDFDLMWSSLKSELEQYSSSNDFETFPDIWDNSEVRFRLGCTEECFRCGALCWNYHGHSDDEGELSKHYACHQARGLATTSAGESIELLALPCSQVSALLMSKRSFSWKEIENDHLDDWKFQKNVTSNHDDLMRWFFQELHMDIAREKKLRSPNESKLKECGYQNLKLPKILTALRNETNYDA